MDDHDRILRRAATLFGIAVALHAVDHLRRGMAAVPPAVMYAGTVQLVAATVTIALVFVGHRWAAGAAVAIGSLSALGFTAAHLLPTWGSFSDSFIDAAPSAHVTWFSWTTALAEIAADVAFAIVGLLVLRARRADPARRTRPRSHLEDA